MKITKSQLKEIIKEEAVKLQKKSILENRKKEITKELRQLNEGEDTGNPKDTGNPFDLNNSSNLEEFYDKIIEVWTKYCGQSPNDWGVANDNRVILYNLLESGDLARKINGVWSPNALNQAKSGTDFYTNNPEDMEAHLQKMGYKKGGYTLSPGHSIRNNEERLKSFENINENSISDEDYTKKKEQDNVAFKNKRNLESHTLNYINDMLLDNPVNLYGQPWEGRVAKFNSDTPYLSKVSRVSMPHQGESRSDDGSASIEFEDGNSWLSISPDEIKAHGYAIPNDTFRNTDKEGFQTLLGIVQRITKDSGYWSDSDVQKIMRNAMTYFGQYVIDVDNLELYANENWTERIDK